MSTETVRIDWVRDQLFLMRDRFDFPIVMTQPSGVNAADLLPLSLIGCAVWDIIAILKKQRQQLTDLHVTAESARDDEPPWRFRKIHVRYIFSGTNLNEMFIKRAIDLIASRYCSTYATLRDAVEIISDYEIVTGEGAKEGRAGIAEEIAADSSGENAIIGLVLQFNKALNAGDVEAMMELMTEDCVFENTYPAPDGMRYEGKAPVRAFWESLLNTTRQPRIIVEEIFALGDRCIMRWAYQWLDAEGSPGHVRGVDIYKVRDGLIAEKLSYVKG